MRKCRERAGLGGSLRSVRIRAPGLETLEVSVQIRPPKTGSLLAVRGSLTQAATERRGRALDMSQGVAGSSPAGPSLLP